MEHKTPIFSEELDDMREPDPSTVYLLVNAALLAANPEAVARIAEEHLLRLEKTNYQPPSLLDAIFRWQQISQIAAEATHKLLTS